MLVPIPQNFEMEKIEVGFTLKTRMPKERFASDPDAAYDIVVIKVSVKYLQRNIVKLTYRMNRNLT